MLTAVRFQNYKILRGLTVPLSPFTVLIGPNGVGKSTVLDGIFALLQLGDPRYGYTGKILDRPYVYFQEENAPRYLVGPADTFTIEAEEERDDCFGMKVRVDAKQEMSEVNLWRRQAGQERKLKQPDPGVQARDFFDTPDLRRLASVMRLSLDADAIARPSAAAKGIPNLGEDGAGLPTLLAHMARRRDKSVDRVEEKMQMLVPGFQRIEIMEVAVQRTETEDIAINHQTLQYDRRTEEPGFALEVEFDGIGMVPAFHLSEGTRILLALLTLLHSPTRPRLLLLDDVDRALHPAAQVELIRLLRELVAQTPDLQIIATAHSPIVVGQCAKNEVVVLKRNDDGCTGIAHPEEAPGILSTSELLYRYFSLTDTLGASELIQEYGLYAGDARRTDEEDEKMAELAQKLKQMGINELFPPVARKKK